MLALQQTNSQQLLTSRWTPLNLHDKQRAFWRDEHRFIIVPAGRRSCKTELSKRRLVRAALKQCTWADARYIAAAPTFNQAKKIYWTDLKALIPKDRIVQKSESDLTVWLDNGSVIQVMGMDVPERVEGPPLNGIVLDEYGNMKPQAWSSNIRPALADRAGWAILLGVPEGRNHYYDIWCDASSGADPEWGAHTWTTEEILPLYLGVEAAAREIASAMRDLDKLTYQQEYRGAFVTFSGLAYYSFDRAFNATKSLPYNPWGDLALCFDFNVSPGTASVIQENEVNGVQSSCIIGEVYIPDNSNTPAVCRKIIQDWGTHKGHVYLYGDATGGARGTAKVAGSDWDLIKQHLRPVFDNRMHIRVDNDNPAEKVRINSMNSRICSMSGERKLYVDPKCKWMIKDLEGVRILQGGAGEIDKKHDEKLTHLTDGAGYYITRKFPIHGGHTTSTESV